MWRSTASLTFGADGGDAFGRADVPHPDGLVPRCGHKQVRVGWMPTELVNTVVVASVVILFNLGEQNKGFNENNCLGAGDTTR